MRRTEISPEDKRLTLRLNPTLWRQLRIEAARRDVSTTLLINQLLAEKLQALPSTPEPAPEAGLAPALNRLQELRQRQEGWNGYDALPPRPEAITYAEEWLRSLHREAGRVGTAWREPHVTSSAEGEVVFEWWNDPKKVTIYCSGNEANFVKVWGPDMDAEMEDGDATSPTAQQQLWAWLTS